MGKRLSRATYLHFFKQTGNVVTHTAQHPFKVVRFWRVGIRSCQQ